MRQMSVEKLTSYMLCFRVSVWVCVWVCCWCEKFSLIFSCISFILTPLLLELIQRVERVKWTPHGLANGKWQYSKQWEDVEHHFYPFPFLSMIYNSIISLLSSIYHIMFISNVHILLLPFPAYRHFLLCLTFAPCWLLSMGYAEQKHRRTDRP